MSVDRDAIEVSMKRRRAISAELGRRYPELGALALNTLERLEVLTPEELAQKTEAELAQLRNCGKTTIRRLRDWLAEYGLSFTPPPNKRPKRPAPASSDLAGPRWTKPERAVLDRLGVKTPYELATKTVAEVLAVPGCGRRMYSEARCGFSPPSRLGLSLLF